MPRALQLGLGGLGIVGALAGASHLCSTHFSQAHEEPEVLVQIAALTLSEEVVYKTVHDPEFKSSLGRFGLLVLTNPETVRELKRLAKSEFTQDTPTRAALKKFIVKDVILDSWVKEDLLNLVDYFAKSVRSDPDIYPSAVLSWLGRSSLEGLRSPAFQEKALLKMKAAVWDAVLGLPPPGSRLLMHGYT